MPSSATTPRSILVLAIVCLATLCATRMVGAQGPAADSPRRSQIVQAIERAMPSVVNISSEKRHGSNSRWPFSAEETSRPRVAGMGTGVIIDQRGYILTNQHVVEQVQNLEVQLADGTRHSARVVHQDKSSDLALIKIEAGKALPTIRMGTSSDLMVGETVITIGNAFGYENTTSLGIISSLHRNVTLSDEQVYRNLIQTDAGINPGKSGGPLLNVEGELIGINVATRAGAQGIGFALPIDDVKKVAAEMISTRRLAGTWHGLVAAERVMGRARRVLVSNIQGGSPAEAAGLKPGDSIVRVNDLQVTNPIDIERALLDARPGKASQVVIDRQGKEQVLSLEVQAAPSGGGDAVAQVAQLLGVQVVAVPAEYVTAASPRLRGGLYVKDVVAGSLAAQAEIVKGDILIGLNVGEHHWETIRPENVLFVLQQSADLGAGGMQFYVVRQNVIRYGQISTAGLAQASTLTR